MPTPVGVVVLYYTGFLLYDLCACAGTRHGRAEEHVDDEHDQEHETKRNAEVEQPGRSDAAVFTQLADH